MKLKYSFEPVDMGDEIILVPVGKSATIVHGVVKLNREGLEIINMLNSQTSEDDLVKTLTAKYENDRDELVFYVHHVLDQLQKAGLLEE